MVVICFECFKTNEQRQYFIFSDVSHSGDESMRTTLSF